VGHFSAERKTRKHIIIILIITAVSLVCQEEFERAKVLASTYYNIAHDHSMVMSLKYNIMRVKTTRSRPGPEHSSVIATANRPL